MKKLKLDQYFVEETNPYSRKAKFKLKNIAIAFGVLVVGGIVFILFSGNDNIQLPGPLVVQASSSSNAGSISVGGGFSIPFSTSLPRASAAQSRPYTASQIVQGTGGGVGLPPGSTFVVRLLNKVISSDANQPVIAEVPEDVVWKNSRLIPAMSKILGASHLDQSAKRLQIRFQTVVFPEGDQHSISALGLASDGSSGLSGDYHSGDFQKQSGRFMGSLLGGLAAGLKDKEKTQIGLTFEPGSLKNGLLNGLSEAGVDQAKHFSEDVGNVKPFIEVPAGQDFVVYIEKEFSP